MSIITRLSLFAGLTLACLVPVFADAPTAETPAVPDKPTMVEVMAGKLFPLTLQLKEMATGWSTFTCGSSDSASNLMGIAEDSSIANSMLSILSVRYTRGQTVELGGESYLVAYGRSSAPIMKMLEQAEQDGEGLDPMKLLTVTPETVVMLQLLNVRTIGYMDEIRPFNRQEITSANAAFAQALVSTYEKTSFSQLRQIAIAVQMYMQDNNGKFPPLDSLVHFQQAVLNYLGNNRTMVLQPSTNIPYQANLALAGKIAADINNPTETVVVYEAQPWPDGKRGVGYCDGHAGFVTEAEWAKLKATVK